MRYKDQKMKNYDKDFIKEITLLIGGVIAIVIVTIALSILAIPIHALILMLAWNYALTTLFGLPHIGFLQSVCLVLIARLLIKSSSTNVHNSGK